MNPSRTPRVRLFSGSAAGVLALAALAVTSPAAEAASVRAAAAPASAAVTTSAAPVAAKKTAKPKTLRVRTSKELRRAVGKSNNRSGPYRIVLTDNVNLNPSSAGNGGAYKGDLDVLDNLIVEGRGHYINARRIDRIFDVPAGQRLVLKGITLKNGRAGAGESGGALRNAGTAILQNVTIVDSVARGTGASGGGAFNDGGTLKVSDSDIKRNRATRAGGGVEADGGAYDDLLLEPGQQQHRRRARQRRCGAPHRQGRRAGREDPRGQELREPRGWWPVELRRGHHARPGLRRQRQHRVRRGRQRRRRRPLQRRRRALRRPHPGQQERRRRRRRLGWRHPQRRGHPQRREARPSRTTPRSAPVARSRPTSVRRASPTPRCRTTARAPHPATAVPCT